VATIKILYTVGGGQFLLPEVIVKLLWIVAALTMTVGNVLGLLQTNIKRLLAYSSVAHSGYMLVAVASLGRAEQALPGVVFYLTAYGLMNAAAFGVLMLLPSRAGSGSAETFEDIAGQGRRNLGLGLAMTVACFSLIGLPLTIGFLGKIFLIQPALAAGNIWLAIILVANAAVSAAYYLRIVGNMFLRLPTIPETVPAPRHWSVQAAVVLSVVATLVLGSVPPITQRLSDYVNVCSRIQILNPGP